MYLSYTASKSCIYHGQEVGNVFLMDMKYVMYLPQAGSRSCIYNEHEVGHVFTMNMK